MSFKGGTKYKGPALYQIPSRRAELLLGHTNLESTFRFPGSRSTTR